MNSLYPNPALGLVAYFPAGRLVPLLLPEVGQAGRPHLATALGAE